MVLKCNNPLKDDRLSKGNQPLSLLALRLDRTAGDTNLPI